MKHALRLVFLLLAAALLCACAHIDPAVTQQSRVYVDAKVEKSRLAVNVRPKAPLEEPPKALMYPFWVAQKMDRSLLVGREIGRVFHQTWTGEALFQTLAYDPELVYRGPEQAIRVARRAGADLVIVGIVPYIIAGGSIDSSAISLQIRIYDTHTGNLLVSMDQSARVNAKATQDWIVFSVETRLSDSPLTEAVAGIAHDMAIPLRSWLPPTDEALGFADNAADMSRGLVASGQPASSAKFGVYPTPGHSVNLKVEFDVDSARIRPSSYPLLDQLVAAVRTPELQGKRLLIAGHTDSTYTMAYNQTLSENRARSVKEYLVERGNIDPKFLRTIGYGKTRPLVPNTTKANMQRNRRVEVRLD